MHKRTATGTVKAAFLVSRFTARSSGGFTLIEVLLAMAILAAVVGIVYASFSTAGRSIKHAEEVRDGSDLARTLMARLCDDINNAYHDTRRIDLTVFLGKKEETDVDGEMRRTDSLTLTTLTNWRRPATKEMELWEVGYRLTERPDGEGLVLLRREKRDLSGDSPPLEGGVEYQVTDKIDQLRFRYYLSQRWEDEWDGKRGLPRAVEITLVMGDGREYQTIVDVGSL